MQTRNATRLKCCACHEKWRWTHPKCCACHENCNTSSENVAKELRLPRKTTFDTLQNVWMSRSATPATRNETTTHWKPPKMTTSAELPIGTAIRSSYGRLRTVADGCDHKRNVERTHPQPPEWNGNPFYAFAKNGKAKEHPILVVAILYPQFFCVLLLLLYPQVGPWPAVGRKPLNPAMPRRMVVWEKRCWNYKLLLEVDLRSFLNNFLTIFCCVREAKRS